MQQIICERRKYRKNEQNCAQKWSYISVRENSEALNSSYGLSQYTLVEFLGTKWRPKLFQNRTSSGGLKIIKCVIIIVSEKGVYVFVSETSSRTRIIRQSRPLQVISWRNLKPSRPRHITNIRQTGLTDDHACIGGLRRGFVFLPRTGQIGSDDGMYQYRITWIDVFVGMPIWLMYCVADASDNV